MSIPPCRSSSTQHSWRLAFAAAIPALLAVLALAPPALAIHDKDNLGNWNNPGGDKPDKQVPGFLINLGPTGARAVLTDRTFIVKYVFAGSPAAGKLQIDDEVLGVFNKPFAKHTFGNSPHGYEGPIMDMGNAIERAESKDGKLLLNVSRGGKKIDVEIALEPIGAFSPTYPFNCKKSALIRARALKFLANDPDAHGGQAHTRCAVTLALLTGNTPAERAIGRSMALKWSQQSPNAGTWTWGLSYQTITLCEYYLLTHDASVLPMIRTVVGYIQKAEYQGHIVCYAAEGGLKDTAPKVIDEHEQLYEGGFGHSPYHAEIGKNGYGPMQYTTILAVIARQLAARCGVPIGKDLLDKSMAFIHRGTNAAGYVAYGGEFTLNNGPVDPVRWKASRSGDDYVGRVGCAIIGHELSPEYPDSAHYLPMYRGYFMHAYKSMPDGHADLNLGIFWGILGAAASHDQALFRKVMDYHKAFFNMMRCYDGSFTVLPSRNYSEKGYYMSSRYHPTASIALGFGLIYPKLRIQGVEVAIAGVNPAALKGTLAVAYKALVAKDYRRANSALYRPRAEDANTAKAMTDFIDAKWQEQVAGLEPIAKSGDILTLRNEVMQLQKRFMGIKGFDDRIKAYIEKLGKNPWRKEVSTGRAYLSYLGVLQKYKSATSAKRLGQFAEANADSIYGKWAAAVVRQFNADGTITVSAAGKPFGLDEQ